MISMAECKTAVTPLLFTNNLYMRSKWNVPKGDVWSISYLESLDLMSTISGTEQFLLLTFADMYLWSNARCTIKFL